MIKADNATKLLLKALYNYKWDLPTTNKSLEKRVFEITDTLVDTRATYIPSYKIIDELLAEAWVNKQPQLQSILVLADKVRRARESNTFFLHFTSIENNVPRVRLAQLNDLQLR